MAKEAPKCSEFYLACRENKIDLVRSLIKGMRQSEIDRMEPNGSTALHVASYYGHYDIVKLLLEKGASTSIKNNFELTAMEEAKNRPIRGLFRCRRDDPRFSQRSAEAVEWIRVGKNMDDEAKAIRKMLKQYHSKNKKRRREHLIDMIDLGHYEGIDKIQAYFDQANKENDPTFLITAYTDDTEFYSRLNRALATVHDLDSRDPKQQQLLDFLQIICCHTDFQQYEVRSTTFRGMQVTRDEFKQYQVGSKILTKTLLSTSVKKDEALLFTAGSSTSEEATNDLVSCLCTYHIRKTHTALDIKDLSIFEGEEEVLVIPYSAFQVVDIGSIETEHGSIATIELRQCKSDIATFAALAAAGGGILAATAAVLFEVLQDNLEF